ncbi:MAG: hypothetical protein DHS20C05_11420 [Hyphococcus sp.]|nr:MAG: hypothetical protein DHS20C05_11420 [Marinicaulis sp.]
MTRNWGIPSKDEHTAFRDAKTAKPLMTLAVSAVFGVIGASIAALSFTAARTLLVDLFHGISLAGAVVAAGFGCWSYIWLARPRFAAHFSGKGDAFSSLLRFYVRAAIILFAVLIAGKYAGLIAPDIIGVILLCASGGAGAAAAFQTVLAFVPYYDEDR